MKHITCSWLQRLAAVLLIAALHAGAGTSLALAQSGDAATAESYEAVLAAGRLTPAEQLRTTELLVGVYYRARNFPKVIAWGGRYVRDGGTDAQTRTRLIEAYYVTDDFANAAKELLADAQADVKAGRTPPAERLQLLASSYIQQKDDAGYLVALELMLASNPKKEYWSDAIRLVATRPAFSDRLTLDVLRLHLATGSLGSAAQYMTMAQLAMQAGYPAEAKSAIDQGLASGTLGSGSDADRQKRLRDTALKQMVEDERLLPQNARDANAAKDGTALVNVGYAMVTAGQFDKGLALMEQGVRKGGLRRPEDARLHLAIAYLAAGQKAKAIDAFKSVQGADGTADLARLWLIHVQRASS